MKNNIVLILAAGLSQRMGYPKGLFLYQNKTLLKWHIENFTNLKIEPLVILGPHNQSDYQIFCPNQFIINHQVELGPLYSLQLGITKILSKKLKSIFILPVDTLPLEVNTIKSLLNSPGEIVIPSFQKKSGHPPKISKKIAEEILNLDSKNDRLNLFFKKQTVIYKEVEDSNVLSNQNL